MLPAHTPIPRTAWPIFHFGGKLWRPHSTPTYSVAPTLHSGTRRPHSTPVDGVGYILRSARPMTDCRKRGFTITLWWRVFPAYTRHDGTYHPYTKVLSCSITQSSFSSLPWSRHSLDSAASPWARRASQRFFLSYS